MILVNMFNKLFLFIQFKISHPPNPPERRIRPTPKAGLRKINGEKLEELPMLCA